MKINFQNNSSFIHSEYNRHYKKAICNYASTPNDIVSFKSKSQISQSAIKYLNSKKIELYSLGIDNYFLPQFDAKQLEGIQNGIEIFKGLSFSQIAYLTL